MFSTHSSLHMSIRIKPDGISFLMVSQTDRKVLYYRNYAVENSPMRINLLENILLTEQPNLLFAEVIKWSFYAETFTIVPENIYEPSHNQHYIKYTCDTKDHALIAAVYSDVSKAYFIFSIDSEINQFITKFSPSRFRLSNTSVSDRILRTMEITGQAVYVDLLKDGFFILIGNKGKLLLYNYFKTDTPEDVVYHVLFCMEQFGLNPEKIPVMVSGYISENDANHVILKKFIKNLHFASLPKGVDFHPLIGDQNCYHNAFTQIFEVL
ncbi:MAG: DUF3822 family protein [Thermaurantimonas sp.]